MKIYIATHKKVKFPENEIYLPIQVGGGINKDIGIELKDNIGENISYKNKNFCELTVIYWMWQNCVDDVIGLVHYRRYFFNNKFNKNMKEILDEVSINNILKEHDIIIPKKKYLRKYNVYEQYKELHNINDLEECKEIIAEKYPEYINSFEKIMKRKYLHPYNMFIGKKKVLDKYFEWLFDVLFELEKRIDISKYDKYNSRVYGFLSERLFNVWIDKNIDEHKIKELYVNNIEENVFKEQIKNTLLRVLTR